MTALYEMTSDMMSLKKLVDESEEMGVAVSDTLESLELEFNDKAIAIVKFATSLQSDTTEIDNEIKRLQDRKKTIQNKQDGLKEYLRTNMEASGITKIECPLFSITLRKGSQQVQIIDESKLPDEYLNVKTSITPDKREILKSLKDGIEIPGAEIVNGKTGLIIK